MWCQDTFRMHAWLPPVENRHAGDKDCLVSLLLMCDKLLISSGTSLTTLVECLCCELASDLMSMQMQQYSAKGHEAKMIPVLMTVTCTPQQYLIKLCKHCESFCNHIKIKTAHKVIVSIFASTFATVVVSTFVIILTQIL